MSGSEAKSNEDPAELFGLVVNLEHPRQPWRGPSPFYSVLALLMPVAGLLFGLLIGAAAQRQDGSGGSWVPTGLVYVVVLTLLGILVGQVLAIYALWRVERWTAIAFLAFLLNGSFIFRWVHTMGGFGP